MAATIYVEVNFYKSLSHGLVAVILLFFCQKNRDGGLRLLVGWALKMENFDRTVSGSDVLTSLGSVEFTIY